MALLDLLPGTKLFLRDGREIIFLYYGFDGDLCCKYGPGEDQISFWSFDGRKCFDDPDFISDADIVGFPLF